MRLKSEFFAKAIVRSAFSGGAFAAIERRGSDDAGAIAIIVDYLDGTADLYLPSPQAVSTGPERTFERVLVHSDSLQIRTRLASEIAFDSDLWIIAIDDRQGRAFLP